ncbi:acyl-CoA thioesterase [Pelagibacterium xiamenense]|uniref:acyl-CoA thioesterase n=1 Tax=Pelagibacterium xiamenense TaxID=2901140 RepID=UPI001E44125B|nr:acyl-CoA thioesterase [Pelagibacterium xiamenense]MCD7060256.1 acyl-CoA thioesterase [Pelagibacterium xiamenense]
MADLTQMTTIDTQTEPRGELTVRTMPMPADTNQAGDIFGGYVMSQMDIAGAICAIERVGGRVATVAVKGMTFIAPVKVGDVLCIYAWIEKIGTTSITIGLEGWTKNRENPTRTKVSDAHFIYVALDDDGKKRVIT